MEQSLARAAGQPKTAPSVGGLASMFGEAMKPAEKQITQVSDAFTYTTPFKLSFIGAGQGGGRIAQAFYRLGYRRVCAYNLTSADFKDLEPSILKYSPDVGGAARDVTKAETVLKSHEDDVRSLIARAWGTDTELAMVCASLGGGTGSGSIDGIVKIVRDYMTSCGKQAKCGAIVSLPEIGEGPQPCYNTVRAIGRLTDMGVAPIIILDNEKINRKYKPGVREFYPKANGMVADSLNVFLQLCNSDNAVNQFDTTELWCVLNSGIVVMGAAKVGGPTDIRSASDVPDAIRQALTDNLLSDIELKEASHGAVLFVGNEQVLDMASEYFDAGKDFLQRSVMAENGVLFKGVFLDPECKELVAFFIVGGVKPPKAKMAELVSQAELAKRMGIVDKPSGSETMTKSQFFGLGN